MGDSTRIWRCAPRFGCWASGDQSRGRCCLRLDQTPSPSMSFSPTCGLVAILRGGPVGRMAVAEVEQEEVKGFTLG